MVYKMSGQFFRHLMFVLIVNAVVVGGHEKNTDHVKDVFLENYRRPVVSKCCNLSLGFFFENKSNCAYVKDDFLVEFEDRPEHINEAKNLSVNDRYEYYIGDPCYEGKYILDSSEYPNDNFSIFSNGTLLYYDRLYNKEEFCLENVDGVLRGFMCFESGEKEYEMDIIYIIYASGLLISIPFLLATALVYLCVDMFRDLRGKSLACHVLCLAIGYFFLALVQLGSDELNEQICIGAGFVIQFFFVAAFFWLNVICYDTWRCINNDFCCIYKPTNLRSEKTTFCFYSLYGWYCPSIVSIVSLVMDLTPAIPDSYLKPNFGLRSCWFYTDDAALPYFYGPVGIVIVVNIIFFILSARKIYTEPKKSIRLMTQNSNSEDKTRQKFLSVKFYTKTLQECVYLFGIMGINWVAEVISWALGGSTIIWVVTDLFNALVGVSIFYLFVIKPISVRNIVKFKFRKTWKKIVKCDCKHEEEHKRISRHWHTNIHEELEDSINLKELLSEQTHL